MYHLRSVAAITCLAICLLGLHVPALGLATLPFDVHNEPCTYWPDQQGVPCQCLQSCSPNNIYFASARPDNTRNIAYNKPATVSSAWLCTLPSCNCHDRRLQACAALNGNLNVKRHSLGCIPKFPANCIRTDLEDRTAWWFVDLQRPYPVYFLRYYIIKGEQYKMNGVTEFVDGQSCHTWPGYDRRVQPLQTDFFTFYCQDRGIRGQYFRIQKRRTIPNVDVWWDMIDVCEVQVFSCPTGFFGQLPHSPCRPCPQPCFYFCDSYWGCQDPVIRAVTNNAAIHSVVTGSSETTGFSFDKLVDGVSVVNRDIFCWKSRYGQPPHFVRVQLDGPYLVVDVRLSSFLGEAYTPYEIAVVATHRITSANVGHQADEVVCYEQNGPLGEKLIKMCSSCTEGDLKTCPRGAFVTAVEKSRNNFNLCEMEVFGLPIKEVGVGQPCQRGASCGLVFCEGKILCTETRMCSLGLDGPCLNDGDCSLGKCSNVSYTCRLPLNSVCAGFENFCMETLICDGFENQCKLDHGEPCQDDRSCYNRFVCDFNGFCKNPVGGECTTDIDCVAGAVCNAEPRQCRCNTPYAQHNGTICVPNDACSKSSTKCPEGMTCDEKSMKCTCDAPTQAGHKFECRIPLGGACTVGGQGIKECIEDAKCTTSNQGQENRCQASANARCDPKRTDQCNPETTICDSTVCRCRVIPGKPCSPSEPCASSYICQLDTDKLCHVRPLGDCARYEKWCADHYECVDKNGKKACLLKNGAECNDALPELKCQESAKCLMDCEGIWRCLQDIGRPCSETLRCREGARCYADKCYRMVASPCNSTDECGPGQICDQDKRCRILKNEPCGHSNGTYCQLRTRCANNKCACDLSISSESSECAQTYKKAKGLAYMVCEKNCKSDTGQCNCANAGPQARCDNDTSVPTCMCLEGYEHDQQYKCKPRIGSRCEEPEGQTEDNVVCASKATCFERKCVIMLDQPCFGRSSNCKTGLRCNCDLCKVNLGFGCNSTDQCFGDYVCDPLAKKCALKVNSSCQRDIDCVSGAFCHETDRRCVCDPEITKEFRTPDGRCIPRDGLPQGECTAGNCFKPEFLRCEDGTCVCKSPYKLDPTILSCKLGDGVACGFNPNITCLPGSLCDKSKRECKRHPGSPCVSSTECTTGAICFQGVCKVDIYKDCSDFPSQCIPGTSCDAANQCKLLVHSPCNYTVQPDSCLAGALCINNSVCKCDERYTTDGGFACIPLVGRVNGRCQLGDEKCSVPGAECPDGSTTCLCPEGYGVDYHTFTCTGVPENPAEEKPNYAVIVSLWITGIVLLIILLIVMAYVYRVSATQKKDHVMEEMAERRAQIIVLQDQVHELEVEEEIVRSGSSRLRQSTSLL